MARSRGGRPAPRPVARSPPPSTSRPYSSSAAPAAPAAPHQSHAPAPAPSYAPAPSSGGGMLSGLAGTVATGMALGTGSAIAHRAVDSAMGMFSSGSQPAPAQAQAAAQEVAKSDHPCSEAAKQFAECMSRNGGDMGPCDYFFNAMQQCKMQYN